MQVSGNAVRTHLRDSLAELWVRPSHQLPALDAVRAVAVIAVILSHFYAILWLDRVPLPMPDLSTKLPFYYGWTGVDLFFVLSGFLIGRQLWREKQRTGTIRIGSFLLRRGFRIWPLYFAMLLLGLTFGVFQPTLADAFLLSNYFESGYPRSWSLSTEEQFYIAVPVLLILTPFIRKLHWYFWLLGAVLVSVWVSRYFAWEAIVASGGALSKGSLVSPIHLHNEALIAGLAIALLSVVRPDYFEVLPKGRFSIRGMAIVVAACGIAAVLYSINSVVFSFTALGLIFGSITLWLMWDRSWLSRPASWRIWYPISRLSYGMYLNHFLFFTGSNAWVVLKLFEVTGSATVASWFGIIVGTLISAAVAVITFVCVERPFLLWREEVTQRTESRSADSQPRSGVPSGL